VVIKCKFQRIGIVLLTDVTGIKRYKICGKNKSYFVIIIKRKHFKFAWNNLLLTIKVQTINTNIVTILGKYVIQ